jgi:hypothetical protein
MMRGVEPGRTLAIIDWAGTAVFAVVAVVAAVFLGPVRYLAVAMSLGLFAIGCVAFLWAYGVAVQRSREVEIGIGGLYFLAGRTAPRAVQRWMNGALTTQVVVALVTASVRPFTTLAFGVLVPMFGLGLNGLWGAWHGWFGPRIADRPRPAPVTDEAGATRADVERPPEGGAMEQNASHG